VTGKLLALAILIAALAAGAGMYYLQLYHFYEPVEANGTDDVELTSQATGQPETVPYADFEGIDAESSPIRYRACFTTPLTLAEAAAAYVPYESAEPLTAPGWFECFDAETIGAALENGGALAFMGRENIHYGIDRIVAITADGRGFAWHQINRCGEVVFDGNPVPEDCPAPPEGN
jgi:hypothetical protein